MDRRFSIVRAIPESAALDFADDVVALSQQGRAYLVQAHSAHVADNWSAYLDAVDGINTSLVGIKQVADCWRRDVEDAPQISPGQLALAA